VKAASVLYLEKTPEVLSLAELTALSIIPNRPTSLRPGENNDVIIQERNKWLQRFKKIMFFPTILLKMLYKNHLLLFALKDPKWQDIFVLD
jgi:membrane carboxypeptidase/penicillin-binding protein PbpC